MYIALLVLLLAVGGVLVFNGVQRRRPKTLLVGFVILLVTTLFFGLLSFWGEMLWFEELGQSQRFWTVVFALGGFAALGALVGGLGVFILTLPIPVQTPLVRVWPALAGALSGALWGCWNWQIILKYIYGVSTGIRDPILQRDTGFYLFTLPFYDSLYWGLLWTAVIALAAAAYLAIHTQSFDQLLSVSSVNSSESRGTISAYRIFWLPMAAITGVVAWGEYLNIYHLLVLPMGRGHRRGLDRRTCSFAGLSDRCRGHFAFGSFGSRSSGLFQTRAAIAQARAFHRECGVDRDRCALVRYL